MTEQRFLKPVSTGRKVNLRSLVHRERQYSLANQKRGRINGGGA